jgi:hypothetical protein
MPDRLVEIFCEIGDFYQVFFPRYEAYQGSVGKK